MTARESYSGRRVVVTGCASGIGEQTALRLIDLGAEVVGLDLRPPAASVAEYVPLDLADSDSIARAADACGSVDALFNVAGVSGSLDPALVVGINFVGTRELTEALVPRMRPGGSIANTASLAASRYLERRELVRGVIDAPDRSAAADWVHEHPAEVGTGYAISKDALVWYTLQRSVALAADGIRMNAIAPGVTDTPILDATRAARGDAFLDAIPVPLGRISRPEEQAAVLVFLNSTEASYLAGQVLWVDGGYSAGVAAGTIAHATGSVGEAPTT